MPQILASEALIRENKKIQQQNVVLRGNRITGLGFQVQHAPFWCNWALATWEMS